ncbi:heterokaryon incompatibility protein-domain-containing protein [Cubamyces lactineus]|nr:heterokaryon incompatibility protein-domain-containing protein [Cubamyces lactineus]
MWVLNTTTYNLEFKQDASSVAYAILSHVWDHANEQTFQDIRAIHASARQSFQNAPKDDDPELLCLIREQLSPKVRQYCDYARAKGLMYAWMDSCCIDKTSSAELSEAINSMFDWYSYAEICYVYLADVSDAENPVLPGSSFRRSKWFTRGWTLQELVVPWGNVFLSKDWRMIGTKTSLAKAIQEITGIDLDVLLRTRPLHTISVARRMSWAANRETTRVEDEAYCLMGIFGVRFPAVYGEGRQAFIRLQEEILKRIPDQTLLAWGDPVRLDSLEDSLPIAKRIPLDELRASKGAYMFASCPADFSLSASFSPIAFDTLARNLGLSSLEPPIYLATSYGIRITLPVYALSLPCEDEDDAVRVQLAILACQDEAGRLPALIVSAEDSSWKALISGVILQIPPSSSSSGGVYVMPVIPSHRDQPTSRSERLRRARTSAGLRHSKSYPRMALLDPALLSAAIGRRPECFALRTICVPLQRLQVESQLSAVNEPRSPAASAAFTCPCHILLPYWTMAHLQDLGATTNVDTEDGELKHVYVPHHPPPGFFSFHIYHRAQTIMVLVYHCPNATVYGPLHVCVTRDKENTQLPPQVSGHLSGATSRWNAHLSAAAN